MQTHTLVHKGGEGLQIQRTCIYPVMLLLARKFHLFYQKVASTIERVELERMVLLLSVQCEGATTGNEEDCQTL